MGELKKAMYKTSEVAEIFGVSDETVRRWMKLLSPPATPLGFGNHVYSKNDVERLQKAFKKADR